MAKPRHTATSQSKSPGRVISLPIRFAAVTLKRDFYLLDIETFKVLLILKTHAPDNVWSEHSSGLWLRKETPVELSVFKTSEGWIANRNDEAGDTTLAHTGYLLPILFPSAEVAQLAADLCFPDPHPALSFREERPSEISGPDPVLGCIGWRLCLPEFSLFPLMEAARAA